jgi:hypothetical protein
MLKSLGSKGYTLKQEFTQAHPSGVELQVNVFQHSIVEWMRNARFLSIGPFKIGGQEQQPSTYTSRK